MRSIQGDIDNLAIFAIDTYQLTWA